MPRIDWRISLAGESSWERRRRRRNTAQWNDTAISQIFSLSLCHCTKNWQRCSVIQLDRDNKNFLDAAVSLGSLLPITQSTTFGHFFPNQRLSLHFITFSPHYRTSPCRYNFDPNKAVTNLAKRLLPISNVLTNFSTAQLPDRHSQDFRASKSGYRPF